MANHPDYAAYAPVQVSPLPTDTYQVPAGTSHPPQALREMLKYPWYHGNIPRSQATSMLMSDGDFLMRDSVSDPGEYVLTCRHLGNFMNFKVNKQTVVDPVTGVPKRQYQFEEELFDRVPELIQFYVETQKAVTQMSGAVIKTPIGRTENLDYGELKLSQLSPVYSFHTRSRSNSPVPNAGPNTISSVQRSVPNSPSQSPKASPQLRRKNHPRAGSQPLLSLDDDANNSTLEKSGSLPFIGQSENAAKSTEGNVNVSSHTRCGSEPMLDSTLERQKRKGVVATESGRINTSEGDLTKPPPPKPLRTPSLNVVSKPKVAIRNKTLYEDDGRDYSDYDQVKAWPDALKRAENGVEKPHEQWSQLDQDIPPPQDDYDEIDDEDIEEKKGPEGDYAEISDEDEKPLKNEFASILRDKSPLKDHIYDSPTSSPRPVRRQTSSLRQSTSSHRQSALNRSPVYMPKRTLTMPKLDTTTVFDLDTYASRILTPDNSILEASSLSTVKSLLLAVMPLTLAQHLTFLDLELLKVSGVNDLGLGIQSGLELVLLPQGERMRKDVTERCRCLQLFVATTLVTCPQPTERARMLEQWIRVAGELKAMMGNLLAFSVIMNALQMPQVKRLASTWSQLQRAHFQTHQMYEFKLRGEYRTLAQGTGGTNLGTSVTVPNILPALQLYDCDNDLLSGDGDPDTRWEYKIEDADVDGDIGAVWGSIERLSAHFENARAVAAQYGSYRSAAENVMRAFHCNEDVMDMLRTELHLRLLFGMKATGSVIREQYRKFEQVLQAFSMKMEPPVPENTAPQRETAL